MSRGPHAVFLAILVAPAVGCGGSPNSEVIRFSVPRDGYASLLTIELLTEGATVIDADFSGKTEVIAEDRDYLRVRADDLVFEPLSGKSLSFGLHTAYDLALALFSRPKGFEGWMPFGYLQTWEKDGKRRQFYSHAFSSAEWDESGTFEMRAVQPGADGQRSVGDAEQTLRYDLDSTVDAQLEIRAVVLPIGRLGDLEGRSFPFHLGVDAP